MYAQLVETGAKRVKSLEEMSPEEREFQLKIDAETKIEAKNWMPEGYRTTPRPLNTSDTADQARDERQERRH